MASELCITKDALLQKPQAGLTYPSTAQETPPFTINGAPLTIAPQSLKGLTEFVRLPKATKDTSNLDSYFAEDNYYTVNLATENILGADPNTTLRFQNQTYTVKFIAIHAPIWPDASKSSQLSALFVSATGHFFHICIPITYDGTEKTANPFLNSWLRQPAKMPAGFTMNQLLNFGDATTNVEFATLEYCLLYNREAILKPYTFCMFKTPLKVVQSTLPEWLAKDLSLTKPEKLPSPQATFNTYRRKTFDDIFNYFMRGVINVYVYKTPDPYLIGKEAHFDSTRTQNATIPSYFQVKNRVLLGTKPPSINTNNPENLVRTLNNVKCYPIDLATQVDENGNIFIDETTNQPINIGSVVSDASGSDIYLDISANPVAQDQSESWIRFIIAFTIIFLILLTIIIVLVVFLFRGTSYAAASAAAVIVPSVASASLTPVALSSLTPVASLIPNSP